MSRPSDPSHCTCLIPSSIVLLCVNKVSNRSRAWPTLTANQLSAEVGVATVTTSGPPIYQALKH